MPKRLLFKKSESNTPPEGYISFSFNDSGEISLRSDSPTDKVASYEKSVESTTLICDSQNFPRGTQSIYVYEYWGKFDVSSDAFHICRMATLEQGNVFPNPSFDINKYPLIWGLFKEQGNKLVFTSAHSPIEELGLKLSDYVLDYGQVISIDTPVIGTSSDGTYNTTGGSGTGLVVEVISTYEITSVGLDTVSFIDPAGYAGQTLIFDAESTTGSGSGAQIEVTFDVDGNFEIYVDPNPIITSGNGYYLVGDVVTTNDLGNGTFSFIIQTVNKIETTVNVSESGKDYKIGDSITVDGNDITFNVTDTVYPDVNWQSFGYNLRKIEDGIEFIYYPIFYVAADYFGNTFVRFKMIIDGNGVITGSEIIDKRDVNDADYGLFSDLNTGWDNFIEGNFDINDYLDTSFMTGTNFFYIRNKEVDSVTYYSFCKYDITTNVVTELIEDIQTWWETYADIPWVRMGENGEEIPILSYSNIISHPDCPMIITSYTTDTFDESYAIIPSTGPGVDNKFFRFGDLKTADFRAWQLTKDKIYLIKPLLN
jgi:hypothetical protein